MPPPQRLILAIAIFGRLLAMPQVPAMALPVSREVGQLSLSLSPVKLPADGRTYETLFVQLLAADDSRLQPREGIKVFLTNSNLDVASLPVDVTVGPDSSYAVVPVSVTHTPGTAKLTGVAPGGRTGTAELETTDPLGASPPFRLEMRALPPVLFPGTKGVLAISVLGSNNVLHPPGFDVVVALNTSNPDVVGLETMVTMPKLSRFYLGEWDALAVGEGTILAQADGLEAGLATVTVSEIGVEPTEVMNAYAVVPFLPAEESRQAGIVLQVVDQLGQPLPFPCTTVNFTSSASRSVSVPPAPDVECDPEAPYRVRDIVTSDTVGTANITAAAPSLGSAAVLMTTHRLTETRLGVQIGPRLISPRDPVPVTVSVQLLDKSDLPVALHP